MKTQPTTIVATVLLALAPRAASSHHSFLARFDRQSMLEIEGEVMEVGWHNPHAYFGIRATDTDGRTTDWEVETSSVSVLRRLGIADGTIRPGDHIRIAGFPPVGEKREIYARHVLLPGGRELLMETGLEPRWSEQSSEERSILSIREGDGSRRDLGIFRIWSFIRNSPRLFPEAVDPTFDVQSYPMTDAARAALAAFDRVADNPTGNCAPKGMPTIMEQPYPIEIVARDDGNISIRIEEYDLERVVYMDQASAPKSPPPSLLGHSEGRWEGDSLVVTTSRISWPFFSQVGVPQSEAVELVERFTPTADGSRLDYHLTVTDPATFTEPVERDIYWIWIPEAELLPYECSVR